MQEKKIEIQGLNVNYKEVGEGKPILVLHGWGGSSDSWVEVQESLAKEGYKIVVPDLPGFGATPPPKTVWGVKEYTDFVREFARAAGYTTFIILGHSNGGRIATRLAAESPELVEKIIYCSPAIFRHLSSFRKALSQLAHIGYSVFEIKKLQRYEVKTKRFVYRLIRRRDYMLAQGIMRDVMRKMIEEDSFAYLSRIRADMLIIWGDRDRLVPVEDAYRIKHEIPHAKVVIFPEIGHSPHLEIPEKVAETIADFLRN